MDRAAACGITLLVYREVVDSGTQGQVSDGLAPTNTPSRLNVRTCYGARSYQFCRTTAVSAQV